MELLCGQFTTGFLTHSSKGIAHETNLNSGVTIHLLLCATLSMAHGQFTVLHSFAGGASDGFNPEPGLAVAGSTIYGVTIGGGPSNLGTVYSLGAGGGPITLLHTF